MKILDSEMPIAAAARPGARSKRLAMRFLPLLALLLMMTTEYIYTAT